MGRSIENAAIASLVIASSISEALWRIALAITSHVRRGSRWATTEDSVILALALLLSVALGIFIARV